jgi:hypothetical protein
LNLCLLIDHCALANAATMQLGQSARRRLVVVLQAALVVALQEADQAPVAPAPRVGRRDPDRLGTIGGRALERLAYCSAKAGIDDVMPRSGAGAISDIPPGLVNFRRPGFDRQDVRSLSGLVRPRQQPEGGETPGVATAPLTLAGGIMVGLARSIEIFSLHAAVFGVGMTLMAGLMLVPVPSSPAVGD